MTREPPRAGGVPRGVSRRLALAAALLALTGPGPSPEAATRLFISNHVSSNQIGDVTVWGGVLAAATLGGIVIVDPASGAIGKVLASPGGLPSNRILSIATSPSGDLWAGTTDQGLARMRPDGSFRRTLTSFDGLPSDRVQALYVTGDSIWVGTSGGVALFTESGANGQVVLRRSDTQASTGSALASDDVADFLLRGDTLWCATGGGLSTFVGGVWQSRTSLLAVPVAALAEHRDSLWASTAVGPRRYDGVSFTTVASGHFGGSIALASNGGELYSGSSFNGVWRYTGTDWVAAGTGLPALPVGTLGSGPNAALWSGSSAGLARFEAASSSWTPYRSDGPATHGTRHAVADARGVWFATGNEGVPGAGLGAVLHYDGTSWSALTNPTTGGQLEAASVFGLLSDQTGKLWFGHCCSGADPRPRTDRWDPATNVWDRPAATNLFTFAPFGPEVLGGSVEHGNGIYVFDATNGALIDSLTPANTQGATGPGLASNNLRDIAVDPAGRAWFAHAVSGLDVWDGQGTLDHGDDVWLRFDAGLPSLQTTSAVTTGASSGWLGTIAGVARIEGDQLRPAVAAAVNAALASREVRDLALDSGGNLWIGTLLGLARVDAGTGGVEIFRAADGLVSDDVQCLAWDAGRTTLWVGTTDGISEVRIGDTSGPAFDGTTYVYPNPLDSGAKELRLGGIQDEVSGEIRDLTGALIRRFTCDPVQNGIWDLTLADGSRAAPGVYLVVLRRGSDSRILRAAIVR